MKVKELREKLEDCDPEEEVYVSVDPEGNAFKELYGVDNEFALNTEGRFPDGPWLRESALTEKRKKHGWSEEDVNEDAENVVILWP